MVHLKIHALHFLISGKSSENSKPSFFGVEMLRFAWRWLEKHRKKILLLNGDEIFCWGFHVKNFSWEYLSYPNYLLSKTPSSWWFQPIWKICSSNWIISPNIRGENKKYVKPPPSPSKKPSPRPVENERSASSKRAWCARTPGGVGWWSWGNRNDRQPIHPGGLGWSIIPGVW